MKTKLIVVGLILTLIALAAPAYTSVTFEPGRTHTTHTWIDVSHLYRPTWNSWPQVGGSYCGRDRVVPVGTVIWDSRESAARRRARYLRDRDSHIHRGGYGIPPVPLQDGVNPNLVY